MPKDSNPHRLVWLGGPPTDFRSHATGFATRTRTNLLSLERLQASSANHEVHVVTQLVNSLLGVVVFPWERRVTDNFDGTELSVLATEGWPAWKMSGKKIKTLGKFVQCLRHSVAHGNIRFSSNSRLPAEVTVYVANFPLREPGPAIWEGEIRADQLHHFVLKLIQRIEAAS